MNTNDILRSAFMISVAAVSAPQIAQASGGGQASYDDLSADEIYSLSGYGYCDAKKIAHVWGQSIGDAKITIGEKVRNGLEHLADADIASTRGVVRCDWSETQLSYEDAEKLGAFWGETVEDAKTKAAGYVSDVGYRRFIENLGDTLVSISYDGSEGEVEFDEATIFDTYASSGYGYCDAKKIASVWGESDPYQGKLILGNKVLTGQEHLADADIASTRLSVGCAWTETELTYEDAQQLGAYWGETVEDAKSKAASYMSQTGYRKFVEDMGHTLVSVYDETDHEPGGVDPDGAVLDAYFASPYGYCDAKKIAQSWGAGDAYEGKIILGNKVLGDIEHLADADIAATNGSVSCSWEESELSYDDARKLGTYWGRSVEDSKTKVADLMSEMGYKRFRIVMADVPGF